MYVLKEYALVGNHLKYSLASYPIPHHHKWLSWVPRFANQLTIIIFLSESLGNDS